VRQPSSNRRRSTTLEMVLLPAPDIPVSQMTGRLVPLPRFSCLARDVPPFPGHPG
jgi:hypothetical protein